MALSRCQAYPGMVKALVEVALAAAVLEPVLEAPTPGMVKGAPVG